MKDGATAMHKATRLGYIDIVPLLMKRGAEFAATNVYEEIGCGHLNVGQLLLVRNFLVDTALIERFDSIRSAAPFSSTLPSTSTT